jgi:hypothetical protein
MFKIEVPGIVLQRHSPDGRRYEDKSGLISACRQDADFPKFAFFARILRPAIWLGLLDCERRIEPGDRWQVRKDFVRKTPLFDEMLRFDVDLAEAPHAVH